MLAACCTVQCHLYKNQHSANAEVETQVYSVSHPVSIADGDRGYLLVCPGALAGVIAWHAWSAETLCSADRVKHLGNKGTARHLIST